MEVRNSAQQCHGTILAAEAVEAPRLAAKSKDENRPGYDSVNASEFVDTRKALKMKTELLAKMIKSSKSVCIYTGAGISTAAGISDYASKARNSMAPVDVHCRDARSNHPGRSPCIDE